jgi:hypothetical protein
VVTERPLRDQGISLPGPDIQVTGVSGTPWQRYAALMRRLDAVRAAEEARTAAQRQAVAAMNAEVERLAPALTDQGGRLTNLSRRLGLRRPTLDPTSVPFDQDPADGLRQTAQSFAVAAEQAKAAEDRGRRATLLPGWRAGPRNLMIYFTFALVGLVVQIATFVITPNAGNVSVSRVLFVVPAVTFLAGYLTISKLGRIRIVPEPPTHRFGQPSPPNPNPRSVRLGLAVCFLTFPLYIVVIVILHPFR